MTGWKPEYGEAIAQCVCDAFSKMNDARWDPRFRTLHGGRAVVRLIEDNAMGLLLPEITSVLLNNGEPVGFCFLIQTDATVANIPLIGVSPTERKKGMGKQLMRHTLMKAVRQIMDQKILLTEINATVDTDSYFALKMYRRFGFQETTHYPHTYFDRETVGQSYYGRLVFKETQNQPNSCCPA